MPAEGEICAYPISFRLFIKNYVDLQRALLLFTSMNAPAVGTLKLLFAVPAFWKSLTTMA